MERSTNKYAYEYNGHFYEIDMNSTDGKEFLKNCKFEIRPGERYPANRCFVEYNGKWLKLCLTDLIDDVGTSANNLSTDRLDPIKYYSRMCHIGVRIDDRSFRVIYALSDG